MKQTLLLATILCILSIPVHAALVDNGGGFIFDTILDITWSQPNNVPNNWWDATSWASGQTVGGVSGRLPVLDEYDSLYNTLRGDPSYPSLFPDLQTGTNNNALYYWSATEYSANPSQVAEPFTFLNGSSAISAKDIFHFRWAVFDGNVAVPIPGAVWLLGSGLLGIIGIRRKLNK